MQTTLQTVLADRTWTKTCDQYADIENTGMQTEHSDQKKHVDKTCRQNIAAKTALKACRQNIQI